MRRALLLFLSFSLSYSYKILVYNSKCGHSNINFFGNVADILVDAGHDVTSLLVQLDPSWGDVTIKSKRIHVAQSAVCKQYTDALTSRDIDWFSADMLHPLGLFFGNPYSDRFAIQCKATLEETELIERLKNEKFDVMIAENFDMCGIGLSHLIQPKSLINGAASVPLAWMFDEFGLPKAWSCNPSGFFRSSRTLVNHFTYRQNRVNVEVDDLFKEKFGPDFPSLTNISSHAAYTIVNTEPLVEFAAPTLNRIVYVGGLGAREPQSVDKKFDSILDLRPKTVLISFGSVVASSQLSKEVKNSILKAVTSFPDVTFIWKYEKPEDDFAKEAISIAPNLHFFKWIPQNDLLADPRFTAFITHAGMGSTQETMIRGKPGLFVPCFGDQPRNAGMMEHSGLGKVFDKRDFSSGEKFTTAVADLLANESYYENARRIAAMIAKKPFSAKEQLIKTVEFAAEFGPSSALRPQSYDMSFIAYHNLDIIIFVSAIAIVFIVALKQILVKILNRERRSFAIILLNSALADTLAVGIDAFLLQRRGDLLIVVPPTLAYVSKGLCSLLGDQVCFVSYSIFATYLPHSVLMLAFSFSYRYLVLVRPQIAVSKLQMLLFIVHIPMAFLAVVISETQAPRDVVLAALKSAGEVIDSETVTGHIRSTEPILIAALALLLLVSTLGYVVIFIARYAVLRELHQQAGCMSTASRRNHRTLIKALTYHAAVPSVHLAGFALFLLMYYGSLAGNAMEIAISIIPTTIPCINPILTLYFITPYRRLIYKIWPTNRQVISTVYMKESAVHTR